MSKTSQKILLFGFIIFFVAIAVFSSVFKSRHAKIPEGTVGAMAGNLNNEGLFCESDGRVYFSNIYDSGCLYSMNADQTDIKKVFNISAKYINAGGDYLFFYGDTIAASQGLGSVVSKPGMFMIKKDGSHLKSLAKIISQSMLLVDNNIYYQTFTQNKGTEFAKLDLKSLESTILIDHIVTPSSYYNGSIYFNGTQDDHHLYALNLTTETTEDIWGGDIWNPIVHNGYVYYMDVMNNYRLCRYSLSDNVIEILSKDRIDFFNVYGNIIYYQKSSNTKPALKRINIDGTGDEVIKEGVFNCINITSEYTYFKEFGDDYKLFYTPTFGSPNVQEFTNAKEAWLNNLSK